jgi:N-acetylglucosaminyl-diphospho-decaprenol L-rhamnosyltransferase
VRRHRQATSNSLVGLPTSAVTVVVATRDRRESLLRTLGKLGELPGRPPVVVVDHGSSDGSVAAARSAHPGVHLIEAGRDLGAAGRTLGARAARTPYVAFSDDDSWWAPPALERAAALLDRHPRVALVQGRILVGAEERLDATCAEMARSPLTGSEPLPGPPVLGFVACGAVVRREAFLACGGFEPRLGIGGEEELLALDLASAGWQLVYAEDVVAHHHPDPGPRVGRSHVLVRNALWTCWLRRPAGRALRRSVALLAGAGRAAPRALVVAVADGAWVTRRRRVVPAEVEAALRRLE